MPPDERLGDKPKAASRNTFCLTRLHRLMPSIVLCRMIEKYRRALNEIPASPVLLRKVGWYLHNAVYRDVPGVVSFQNFPNSGTCLIEARFHFTTKPGCGFETLEIVIQTDARLYAEICIRINRAKLVQQRHVFFNRASLCAMKVPLMRPGKMTT